MSEKIAKLQQLKNVPGLSDGDRAAIDAAIAHVAKTESPLPIPMESAPQEGIGPLETKIDPEGAVKRAEAQMDEENRKRVLAASKQLPTEYVPEHDPNDVLASFMSSLPAPGSHWREPTLAEFHKENPHLASIGRDSPAYAEYADRKWLEAVAQAKTERRPVVRTSRISMKDIPSTMRKAGYEALQEIPDTVMGGLLGAGDVASAGILTRLAPAVAERAGLAPKNSGRVLEDVMADSPIAAGAGALAGGMKGVPELLYNKTKELVGEGGSLLARAARGAATTGAASGGTKAIENVMDAEAAKSRGETPDLSLAKLAGEPALAAILGGVLGGVAGAATGAHANLRSDLHNPDVAPGLRILSEVGGRPAFFGEGGLKLPAGVRENFAGGGEKFATSEAAGKVVPGLAADVAAAEGAIKSSPEALKMAEYHRSPSGAVAVIPENLGTEVLRIAQKNADLPYVQDAIHRRALTSLFRVSEPSAAPTVPGGSSLLTTQGARALGFDVPDMPGMKVVVTPVRKTAQQIETITDALDHLGKAETGGIPPKDIARLMRAARLDRDKLPWGADLGPAPKATIQTEDGPIEVTGLSALDAQLSAKRKTIEEPLRKLGVNRTKNIAASDIEDALTRAALDLFASDKTASADKALLALAAHAKDPTEAVRLLKEVAATRVAPRLAGKAQGAGGQGYERKFLRGARFRLDPAFGAADRGNRLLTVPLATGALGPGAEKAWNEAKSGVNSIRKEDIESTLRSLMGIGP